MKKYIIESFDNKIHDVSQFRCGIEELDKYLKLNAHQDIKRNITALYLIHERNSVRAIGYYTLSANSIELTNLPKEITGKLPKYPVLPVTLVGRLAVDSRYQKKGIGKFLLIDALVRSYDLRKQIGSYAVIVEAINDKISDFYEKFGFRKISPKSHKLFLPMQTIDQLKKL